MSLDRALGGLQAFTGAIERLGQAATRVKLPPAPPVAPRRSGSAPPSQVPPAPPPLAGLDATLADMVKTARLSKTVQAMRDKGLIR